METAKAEGHRRRASVSRRAAGCLAVVLTSICLVDATSCRPTEKDPLPVALLVQRDVEGLDPHLSGQIWQTQNVLLNLYEGLVAFDPGLGIVPALAESWATPDERTWVFSLRPSVRFHSGEELDSSDVVFSIERARDHPRSALRAALAGIRVEAAGLHHVRLVTPEPDGFLVPRLKEVAIVSRRFVKARGEEGFARASAGTGPFVLGGWDKGERVVLERFESYWGGAARVRRALVVARPAGHPDLGRLLPSGALSVSFPVPGSPAHTEAQENATAQVSPGLSVVYLAFDLRGASTPAVTLPTGARTNPFLDPRVREAISLALDLPRFRATSRAGRGQIPALLVAPCVFGHDPAASPARHDPVRARQLLAATPFASGLSVTLDVRAIMASFAPPVLDALGALGWSATAKVLPDEEFFPRAARGESSLFLLRFSCRTGDAQELLDRWVASKDEARGLGGANYAYDVCPVPGLDDEIDRARHELVLAERKAKLQAALRRVAQARLALPLFVEQSVAVVPRGLSWPPRADGYWLFREAVPGPR